MKYKSSGNVVYSCRYHVVFCPKCRRPVLVDGVDGRLRQIARQVADGLHFEIIEMEAMPGHVRMLLEVDPQLGIHRVVKRIKGRASHGLSPPGPGPASLRLGPAAISSRPWAGVDVHWEVTQMVTGS